METVSIYLNRSSIHSTKKSVIRINPNPHPKSKTRGKSFCHLSPQNDSITLEPIDKFKTPFKLSQENKSRTSKLFQKNPESLNQISKSHQLTSKLLHSLSEKTSSKSKFLIFSSVFLELAEYLKEFKDLLMTLRKGMIVSAIEERETTTFEFRECFSKGKNDLSSKLEKEIKEKERLASKLNTLSDDYINLKEKSESISKKFTEYEKIVKNDPNKFIEAEKLIEKMMDQCKMIQKQQNYIHELQLNETKLKKIIEICQEKGIILDQISKESFNSILNPGVTKIYRKSKTFSNTKPTNLDSSF
jgi:hypothetical protein